MRKGCLIFVVMAILISGCTGAGFTSDSGSNSDSKITTQERSEAVERKETHLVQETNQLGMELFKKLRATEEGRNVNISPYSITAALALAYNGSTGETAAELGELLGYAPAERENMNKEHQALLTLLNNVGSGIELKTANSIWAKEELPLRKEYLSTGKAYYEAEIRNTDFTGQQSVKEINEWVSIHTEDKIKKMLEEPPGKDAVAVLVNAVYFKGGWNQVFAEEDTRSADFHPTVDSKVQVDMMKQSGVFVYAETENWQAIRLPFTAWEMDMLIVLPDEDYSLDELQDELAKGEFQDSVFDGKIGEISLPRFTASYGIDLKDALKALGVKQAFDPNHGDFSDLAETPDPIFINQIIHKSYIKVNEQGSEAAASTLSALMAGGGPPTDEPFKMVVNRPFLFAINDRQTGVMLFLGAIENPTITE